MISHVGVFSSWIILFEHIEALWHINASENKVIVAQVIVYFSFPEQMVACCKLDA